MSTKVTLTGATEYTNLKGDRVVGKKGEAIEVLADEAKALRGLGVVAKNADEAEAVAKAAEPAHADEAVVSGTKVADDEAVGQATKVQATSKSGGK